MLLLKLAPPFLSRRAALKLTSYAKEAVQLPQTLHISFRPRIRYRIAVDFVPHIKSVLCSRCAHDRHPTLVTTKPLEKNHLRIFRSCHLTLRYKLGHQRQVIYCYQPYPLIISPSNRPLNANLLLSRTLLRLK